MSEYNALNIYVLLKSGDKYPVGVTPATKGEGVNNGVLADGRGWMKNCFMSPQEMRSIVHAEDAGLLEIKTAEEMRTLIIAKIPVEIEKL